MQVWKYHIIIRSGTASPSYPKNEKWQRVIQWLPQEINTKNRRQLSRCRSSAGRSPYRPYQLDIMVVDEMYRLPVGRPWITLSIDVFSRMVVGFYISPDPPGGLGTGLCLSHAILDKTIWLDRLDVPGKWPCHGIMKSLFLDNAVEFRGKMLERVCLEYEVELNFRTVTKPHYGGYIERLMGTLLGEIHALPGTTFSNIQDRKDYYCEAIASFTLKELEKWVDEFIVGVYHQRCAGTACTERKSFLYYDPYRVERPYYSPEHISANAASGTPHPQKSSDTYADHR